MKEQTNQKKEDKKPVDRGVEGFHKWASGARKPTKEEEELAKSYSAAQTPFGEPDHVPHSEMEEQFDKQSKENYERLDREVMDSLREADTLCTNLDKYKPLKATERKKVRELIGWQERLLVWMFRIAFMTFMYMYWHVTDVSIKKSQEQIKELQEKVELLNEMFNPTEAPEETNQWNVIEEPQIMLVRN